ncbi:glycosyltransferase family 48 protein [Suhomyces tanzawaensis NRRL Y-17324]|uniref:1,3-beta-glucan synthase n=1 Tax=Suhomyces tanzawaensis NRRL Y-17324 TaxID=984487 RepID=A0A1E4SBG3_9ASCO|nr:glycosyltransferase family 48 protein [Suhomyces tanzawaensis NRRL Y-17324]ODV76843.1 glycosyltransferase family 48 protein [Suhomyces tanzawaensis NRRL Y-17324]
MMNPPIVIEADRSISEPNAQQHDQDTVETQSSIAGAPELQIQSSPISLYPSWCEENGSKYTEDEILKIFDELGDIFGFQKDNVLNMFDHLMVQLDSRSSRMSCGMALLSLHVHYIGGDQANYKKWFFAAPIDEDIGTATGLHELEDENSYLGLEFKWKTRMNNYTEKDYIYQLSLWLLIWGESNNVRYMPECLCFIFNCALEYFYEIKKGDLSTTRKFEFLEGVITPLYCFIRDQQYELVDGKWLRNEKDHSQVIGYDDMNQCFWYYDSLKRLTLHDGSILFDYEKSVRFSKLDQINWNKFFRKTYWEHRTWIHALTNFSRVWVIHVSMFWYFTAFNSSVIYTPNYDITKDNMPPVQVRLSVVSLGGTIASLLTMASMIFEMVYVSRKWLGSRPVFRRLFLVFIILMLNLSPSVYILWFLPLDAESRTGLIISILQFVVSIISFIYFAIQSPDKLFRCLIGEGVKHRISREFNASFHVLNSKSQRYSYALWISVFAAKFLESYFFLTLSLKDPIKVLFTMEITKCHGDIYLKALLCRNHARIILILLLLTDLVLFFLDTYLWYIICNCIFSIGLSFSSGISIFTPWKNIFSRLPERIASKLIFTLGESEVSTTLMVSRIWNCIVLSMYREHLLSTEQVSKLVYQQIDLRELKNFERLSVRPPLFFLLQGDTAIRLRDFFTPNKEGERRISFFAQSLSIQLPETTAITAMPTFTVLVPHYSERIILGLKETIKENKNAKVSLLDYLKELNHNDWESFVRDAKTLLLINNNPDKSNEIDDIADIIEARTTANVKQDPSNLIKNQINDLPFYSIGFKESNPDFTLRTRLWASLRYQTLYRTISGFMNYETAIETLGKVENYSLTLTSQGLEEIDREVELLSRRKFHLLVSMQRYQQFSKEEKEDAYILFKAFPKIKVAYLELVIGTDGKANFYSVMLDLEKGAIQGEYSKKYRIKLSGNPIFGDGKSDNQNHCLIFHRGEYLQVIDANQDNYIEECLKIKTVLAEFEEMELDVSSEYAPGVLTMQKPPVAILGAREYIFSESIGVLGDIAAGKEQTFGTLFSRTMAELGGKLHYGHPDFLNSIFMTTRGGISKAQKGLHLNEDIYAGMTVICRGGRIKHCDYYQCGKGRDLGFGTILNFTAKIGAGMGEQILSREHYYLGTSLPIDRFLTFYYAHPGFHINNVFIMLSIQLFMIVLVNLGALTHESILCDITTSTQLKEIQLPLGCYNLIPVLHWVGRFVLSIFICFFISFMPLIIQELVEKGPFSSFRRMFYHFLSLAPLFEVFVCQIYSKSLRDNFVFGGAKYISTGRGFATARISFATLYLKYAELSIYTGAEIFLVVAFSCLSMWQFSLIWFWITIISMCLAPFIFNPHQFQWNEFFLDYREFIHWLSRGNTDSSKYSWSEYVKSKRSKFTGYKKYNLDKGRIGGIGRPRRINILCSQVLMPILRSVILLSAFLFMNAQNGVPNPKSVNPLLRIIVIGILPFVFNAVILGVMFVLSYLVSPCTMFCWRKGPPTIAALAHFLALVFSILNVGVLFLLQGWNYTRTICGLLFVLEFQKAISNFMFTALLSRELRDYDSNIAWWSGKWFGRGFGWMILSQPVREFFVKVLELNSFTQDFILGHFLLFAMAPCLFVPLVDGWHSSMLFWLKPSDTFRSPIYSRKQRRVRRTRVTMYALLFLLVFLLFVALIGAPIAAEKFAPDITAHVPKFLGGFVQPNHLANTHTNQTLG